MPRSLQNLPEDVLELIVRRTMTEGSPGDSAIQLSLLQRVNRGFRDVARSVLCSTGQDAVGRATTSAQIEHLSRGSTPEAFAAGMRSILRAVPDAGIRLQRLPDELQETALQVLEEQTHLRSLTLDAHSMPEDAIEVIYAMRTILSRNPHLQHAALTLDRCELTNEAVNLIAESAELRSLTALHLGHNALSDEGVATLANSDVARWLVALDLGGNIGISGLGMEALASSDKLTSLKYLDLRNNLFSRNEGAIALANSQHLRLKSLDLGGNNITYRGAAALANSAMARSLTHLGLRSNRLDNRVVSELTNSDKLGNLIVLDFRNNRITAEAARALRARFQHVRLSANFNTRR